MGCGASSAADTAAPASVAASGRSGKSGISSAESIRQNMLYMVKTPSTEELRSRKSLYTIHETIGAGHFAEVRRCTLKSTNEEFAVKIIDKESLVDIQDVAEEVEILKKVGQHDHVVGLVDQFEDDHEFYLVMDLCKGGDLFSRISSEGHCSEKQAARWLRQLASALKHCHERGVAHRDLKPENILLLNEDEDSPLKVADFGLSRVMKDQHSMMRTVCGTWAYCAPEVLDHEPYSLSVDQWTLGVIMYILLSGYHPFDEYGDLPEPKLFGNILECRYSFDDEVWTEVSPEAKRLIRKLLVVDPNGRMSLDEFLASPWISGEDASTATRDRVVERLGQYTEHRAQLRDLVIAKLMARRLAKLVRKRGRRLSRQYEDTEMAPVVDDIHERQGLGEAPKPDTLVPPPSTD